MELVSEPLRAKVARAAQIETKLSSVDLIPSGPQGFKAHNFSVSEREVEHPFIISINVHQLQGRVDDIGFYLFDEAQFVLWSRNQSAVSLILIPRVVRADIAFRPSSVGKYYTLLDNRHSTFTSKTVTVSVTEEWIPEEEVDVNGPMATDQRKPSPPKKQGLWGKFWSKLINKFRGSPLATSILVFLGIEAVVSSFGIVIASYLAPSLGLRSGDAWPFIAALAFGGIVIFGIIYVTVTGRPLPLAPPMT